ncbi:MAG: SAP domain-containing protein [Sneathiella sp.]
MSVEEFDAHYYYATELKLFARQIGIRTGKLRKFEIEGLIRAYLSTGELPDRPAVRARKSDLPDDMLSIDTIVKNYNGNKKTKAFLLELVIRRDPNSQDKSGQWYWLNDWRRKQFEKNIPFTYGDLAEQLLILRRTKGRLPQIPSARMNNFITDFLEDISNKGLGKAHALDAWKKVKATPGEKTYTAYKARNSGFDSA